MSETIRAYTADPNWIKTVAPKTAARIREWVNTHPKLSKIVQFNSLGAAIAGATLGAGGQSGEVNAAKASPEQSPKGNFLKGAKSLPSVPFGLAGQVTKASVYGNSFADMASAHRRAIPFELTSEVTKRSAFGLAELAKVLSQRGLYPQEPKNEK